MSNLQIWKTTIWIGKNYENSVTIFSDKLANLPILVKECLAQQEPTDFSNLSTNDDITKRISCFYSNGQLQPLFPRKAGKLEIGWYYIVGGSGWPQKVENYSDVVEYFIKNAIIVQKGPDYKEIALINDQFPNHVIKKICRETEIEKINEMLKRGWYIISTDSEGKMDYYGKEIISKTTVFLLGHPEPDAF